MHDPFVQYSFEKNFITNKLPNFKNFNVVIFCVAHKNYHKINFKKLPKKPFYFDLNMVFNKKIKTILLKNNYKFKVLGGE